MPDRREYVLALYAEKKAGQDGNFCQVAVSQLTPDGEQKIISERPPPPREVVLALKILESDQMFSYDIKRLISSVVCESVFLQQDNVSSSLLADLRGFIHRLSKQNYIVADYGFRLMFLIMPRALALDAMSDIYVILQGWCKQIEAESGVRLEMDLLKTADELKGALQSELFRAKYCDMMAQFAGKSSLPNLGAS